MKWYTMKWNNDNNINNINNNINDININDNVWIILMCNNINDY